MKKIEFRGKRKDNGQWVYGNLIIDEDRYYICLDINEHIKRDDYEVYMVEVIPETIGQHTGRKDNEGNKIYTDDIVKSGEEIGLVVFDEHYLGYFVNFEEQEPLYDVYIEKIGNKIDNPELLEGGN